MTLLLLVLYGAAGATAVKYIVDVKCGTPSVRPSEKGGTSQIALPSTSILTKATQTTCSFPRWLLLCRGDNK